MNKKVAFTLAETLITLGIIGVVAAMTLPTLFNSITAHVRAEQIRSAKYKFTLATDKMKTLGLIGPYYANTEEFVNELSKHLKIAKICKSTELRGCWPYDKIILENGKEYDISKATTGKAFKMSSSDTENYTSPNVGIITADGVPMILSFNTECEALEPETTYAWSTSNNKPETNATAGCIASIFEVNGDKKPNTFRTDVIAFNSNGLGSECAIEVGSKCYTAPFSPTALSNADCLKYKNKLGIKNCRSGNDDY